MNGLEQLLQWKLLHGSHDFPGPDGGTCINEAALVVAGFAYRKVESIRDLPPCFSRPISRYALRLNDAMNDTQRQRLVPFIPRLAGSADTEEIEGRRRHIILSRTCREIVAPLFDHIGLHDHALKLSNPPDFYAAEAPYAAYAAEAAEAPYAAEAAKAAYAAYDWRGTDRPDVWGIALSILDEALSTGKQAEPVELTTILARADVAKRAAVVPA